MRIVAGHQNERGRGFYSSEGIPHPVTRSASAITIKLI
jgi:hypothetical protein